jgi:hypothetical protein
MLIQIEDFLWILKHFNPSETGIPQYFKLHSLI